MIAKIIFSAFIIFTLYSFIKPWQHNLFDVIDEDGLLVEFILEPVFGASIERVDDDPWIIIRLMFFSIHVTWGDSVKKGFRG